MINRFGIAAMVLGVASSFSASASNVVFAEHFDSNTMGLNQTPVGWAVTDGTVDIIGSGYFDFLPGNGKYIDLDGSTSNAGILSTSLSLTAGLTYTAEFALAGNQRNSSTESVTVSFGNASLIYSLPSSQTFTTYSLVFTPSASGNYSLSFSNAGGDNVGALLDNVRVTAVPEPESLALLLAGSLVVAGVAARRRGR